MNDFYEICLQLLPAFDVIAALLVTLYISVAIFAAQNLFKQIPEFELSISGRSYVKLLSLIKISLLLITIPLLVRIGTIDLLAGDYGNIKAVIILGLLVTLTGLIISEIHGIITQKALEDKNTSEITSPSLKFVAWLIINEPQWSVQRRDLMAGSLASTNKSSLQFEVFLLDQLVQQTSDLTEAKKKTRDNSDYIISLINSLKDNWKHKPLGYPPYIDTVFQYLFQNWLNIAKNLEQYRSGGIYNLRLAYMNGFNSLASYCLSNGLSYDLFKNLKVFTETLSEEDLKQFLLSFDEKILFEEIPNSPENSIIWSDFFPQEWKFTHKNLVDEPNAVAIALSNRFIQWSQNRLLNGQGIDKELDDVALNLFPEVDPIKWARILEYRFAPYVGDNHIEYVVRKVGTFGLGKTYSIQDWTDDEDLYAKRLQDEDEAQMIETVKLTNGIILFSKKHLENALKEVAIVEKKDDLSDRERRKLASYKEIITRLLDDINLRIKTQVKNK